MLSWTLNNLSSFFPRSPAAAVAPVTSNSAIASGAPEQLSVLEANPHLDERRAQALRSLFPKLSSWFGSRRDALFIGEINEYLSQASNVTDLEQRIRVIEQGRHFS